MVMGLALGLVSFIYAVLMTVVYFVKRNANGGRRLTTLFFKLLVIGIVLLGLIEIGNVIAIDLVKSPALLEIISRIHILADIQLVTLAIVYCYVAMVDDSDLTRYTKMRRHLGVFVILLDVTVYMISLFLPITSYHAAVNPAWNVVGGLAMYPVYALSVLVIIASSIMLWRFRKTNPKELTIPVVFFVITFFGITALQFIWFDFGISYIYFLFIYFIIGIFFTVESQDTRLLKAAEESRNSAEVANKAKAEFLASVSHAIRTPMNTILGFSQSLLEERNITEDMVKRDATDIKDASTNLLELINNILDISRIESGKEEVEAKEYKMEDLLHEVNSLISSKITKDVLDFKINVDSNIPTSYKGDSDKIFKIIINVLMNAIKNTKFGNVSLDVGGAYVGSVFKLSLIISNSGHEMSEEEFSKDFDQFSEESTTQGTDSVRLGLIVAKRLIDLMGGTIDFKNEKGKGTRYLISVDQEVIDDMKIGFISIESSTVDLENALDLTGLKALVVDDNTVNIKLATRLLSQFNLSISTADNGQECLDLVKNNEYDIIFLDHMMPGLDGVATVHALRENGCKVPIIALTANSYTGSRDKYISEGFTDYLAKPFRYKDINKILEKYMGQ